MRQRTLKPGFFKNEELAELTPMERLLFIGLLLLADRSGRFEDRPARIRAEIFPYDQSVNVSEMMSSLERCGFVVRYDVSGKPFGLIPTFCNHQHPHPKEPKSVIPAPAVSNAKILQATESRVETIADQSGSSGSSGSSEVAEECNALESALVEALKRATDTTGMPGSEVLAQASVRGKAGVITNPFVCRPEARKLWAVTTDRVNGFVAAWEADQRGKATAKARKGAPAWDRGQAPPDDSQRLAEALARMGGVDVVRAKIAKGEALAALTIASAVPVDLLGGVREAIASGGDSVRQGAA